MRDSKVVIASSPEGLKISMNVKELSSYIDYSSTTFLTMMKRLREPYRVLKSKGFGEIDYFETPSFKRLLKLFEKLD